MQRNLFRGLVLLVVCCAGAALFGQTVGALGNGVSGRSTSLGGATVASITSPLEAMQGNPAGPAGLHGRALDFSVTSLFTTGSFTNSVSNDGSITSFAGALPYGAFAMPLRSGR